MVPTSDPLKQQVTQIFILSARTLCSALMSFPCLFWACRRKFLLNDVSPSTEQRDMSLSASLCSYLSLNNDRRPFSLCVCTFMCFGIYPCVRICATWRRKKRNFREFVEEDFDEDSNRTEAAIGGNEKDRSKRSRGNQTEYLLSFLCRFDYCCCSRYFLCLQSVPFNQSQVPVYAASLHAHTYSIPTF